jgi:hypothetical protein
MDEQFKVGNIKLTEVPSIFGVPGADKVTIVSYTVGTHGPFQDTYKGAEYSEAAAKAGIEKRVAGLRSLLGMFPT